MPCQHRPGPNRNRAHGDAAASLRALALANVRFWPTVVPTIRLELGEWHAQASQIDDDALRTLALEKLSSERFNAEVAATLATLSPRRHRRTAVRAIVALELLFDYLDGRTENLAEDAIAEGRRLFAPFTAAVEAGGQAYPDENRRAADAGYMGALSRSTALDLFALPAARAVAGSARASAQRCAEAQTRLHAVATLGDRQLGAWATENARGSGLAWREYTAGCASSVLAVHALIAAAADPHTTESDAKRLDAVYLAFGGVVTMLDSLVDHSADEARGERGFISLFDSREEFAERLVGLTREALARAREAPHADHHVMTLAGVAAYYTSHPGAKERGARRIAGMVQRELSPTIWPTLAVIRSWRGAKRVWTWWPAAVSPRPDASKADRAT